MEIILDTGSTLISSKMDSVFAFEKSGLFVQKDRFFYLAIIDPFKFLSGVILFLSLKCGVPSNLKYA